MISVLSLAVSARFPEAARAGETDALFFSDNFESLTLGNVSGQNGWTSAGGVAWTVTATSSGQNIVGGNGTFNASVITQVATTSKDTRLKFNFIGPASGQSSVQAWLRRTATASTAQGYNLFYLSDGKFYLYYVNGGSAVNLTNVTMALTSGATYTLEFETRNDGSGNPVLRGWIYLANTSRPSTPTISYVDTLQRLPNAGYVGIGGRAGNANTVDDVYAYSGDANLPDPPDAPPSITPVANSSSEAGLSWGLPSFDGGSAISDYLVEYRAYDDAFAVWADGVSTTRSATLTGLIASEEYDFRVSAVNAYGTGTPVTGSQTLLADGAPIRSNRAPTGALSYGTTSVSVSLDTDEAATCAYSASAGTAFGSMVEFETTGGTSHATAVDTENDTAYTFYVKCQDGSANTNAADYPISFSVEEDGDEPLISSVSSGAPSAAAATITWVTDEAASSTVSYGITGLYGEASSTASLATSHSVTLTGLAAETLYHFQVSSEDAAGNLATSAGHTFVTAGATVSGEDDEREPRRRVRRYPSPTSRATGYSGGVSGAGRSEAPGTSGSEFTPRDLGLGATGEDVRALQRFLNAAGFTVAAAGSGSPGAETSVYGPLTRAAVARWQLAHGVDPAAGYYGPLTRAAVAAAALPNKKKSR